MHCLRNTWQLRDNPDNAMMSTQAVRPNKRDVVVSSIVEGKEFYLLASIPHASFNPDNHYSMKASMFLEVVEPPCMEGKPHEHKRT